MKKSLTVTGRNDNYLENYIFKPHILNNTIKTIFRNNYKSILKSFLLIGKLKTLSDTLFINKNYRKIVNFIMYQILSLIKMTPKKNKYFKST